MSITAIIPAYNEEKTISDVINCVKKVSCIDNVIVVSDGSTDMTAEIARTCGAEVIELEENIGKGGAIKVGVAKCDSDIVLFLDADLIGLTTKHIHDLLEPVLENEADMVIGIFKNGRKVTDLAQKVTPYLSGQRVVRKSIIDNIPNIDISRYGVEVALTMYADKSDLRVKEVYLEDMTHVTKEEKLGFTRGIYARLKMYWDIVKVLGSFSREIKKQ